jgi:FkbM family methyltransferase
MKFIKEIIEINICDIGAGDSEDVPFLKSIVNNCNTHVTGFEPNLDQFNKLASNEKQKYFNFAIGDGTKKKFNICKAPGMSSFLIPNKKYNKMFHHFDEWGTIVKTLDLETKKLDNIEKDKKFDLIKIDVQGYEDEIIKHGKQTIKDTLVLQIELSPVPSYEGGKPFGHITNELESLNFHLHQFSKIETRSFKPTVIGGNSKWGLHYIYQLDCVFIKNFDEIENFSLNDLLKLSYIMYYGFNAFDFVDFLFQIIDKKYNKNYLNDFRKSVLEFKVNKTY